ncbi:hypothetical protein LUU34_01163700 [Aix galericulata]|nr:hypothetical protein LUU34_01163700 [Aix galericulata]
MPPAAAARPRYGLSGGALGERRGPAAGRGERRAPTPGTAHTAPGERRCQGRVPTAEPHRRPDRDLPHSCRTPAASPPRRAPEARLPRGSPRCPRPSAPGGAEEPPTGAPSPPVLTGAGSAAAPRPWRRGAGRSLSASLPPPWQPRRPFRSAAGRLRG